MLNFESRIPNLESRISNLEFERSRLSKPSDTEYYFDFLDGSAGLMFFKLFKKGKLVTFLT